MATEQKHGSSNGHTGNGSHRRRASSLMQAATALPTVESSLEDFIARANATLVDVDQWDAEARAEKERQAQAARDAEADRVRDAQKVVREESARAQAKLEARIATLESEYSVARRRMPARAARRFDRTIARNRVALARIDRGADIEDRMRLLDGYAEYLRALQTIVYEEGR